MIGDNVLEGETFISTEYKKNVKESGTVSMV